MNDAMAITLVDDQLMARKSWRKTPLVINLLRLPQWRLLATLCLLEYSNPVALASILATFLFDDAVQAVTEGDFTKSDETIKARITPYERLGLDEIAARLPHPWHGQPHTDSDVIRFAVQFTRLLLSGQDKAALERMIGEATAEYGA